MVKYLSISYPGISNAILHNLVITPWSNRYQALSECHFLFIYSKDKAVHDFSVTALYSKEVSVSGSLKVLFSMAAFSSFSKGFVWVLDLFPFSGAVPFFALPVRHEAGTETFRHLS